MQEILPCSSGIRITLCPSALLSISFQWIYSYVGTSQEQLSKSILNKMTILKENIMRKLYGIFVVIFSVSLFLVLTSYAEATRTLEKPTPPAIIKADNTTYSIRNDLKDPDKYFVEDRTYKAEFTNQGFTFIKKNRTGSAYTFNYKPYSIKIADRVLWKLHDKTGVKLKLKDNKAIYVFTDNLKEIYEPEKGGIEQSWIINKKPSYLTELKSHEKTDFIIEGKIFTDLKALENKKGGIDFINGKDKYVFSYGKVTVKDSKGKTLQISPILSTIDRQTPSIKILVSAAWLSQADYPVIIDPFIGNVFYGNEMIIGADLAEYDQDNSSIACGNDNVCLTVFEDYRNGSNGDIYGQFLTYFSDQVIYWYTGYTPGYALVMDGLITKWMCDVEFGCWWSLTNYTGDYNFPIDINGLSKSEHPVIASDGTDYVVVWQEDSDGDGKYDIYGRLLTLAKRCDKNGDGNWQRVNDVYECTNIAIGGKTLYKEEIEFLGSKFVIATAEADERNPAVAFDEFNSRYLVVWQIYRSFQGTYGIRGRLVTVSPSGVPSLGSISSIAGFTQYEKANPVVDFDMGNYLVVWQEKNQNGDFDIYGRQITASGDPYINLITVANNSQDEINPAISFGSNKYIVVWQRDLNGSQDVHGQFIDTLGNFVGSDICIACTPQNEELPSVSFGGTNYLVVWSENSSSVYGIYGQFVDTSGSLINNKITIPDSNAVGDQVRPYIAFDSSNSRYITTWTDSRGLYNVEVPIGEDDPDGATDGTDIYAQEVPISGDLRDIINIPITNDLTKNSYFTRVAGGTDRYLAVWDVDKDGDESREIYGQLIDRSGTFLDKNFLIAKHDIPNGPSDIDVAFNSGKFLVVHTDQYDPNNFPYGKEIVGKLIDERTGDILSETTILSNNTMFPSTGLYGFRPIGVESGNNNFLVIWSDRRKDDPVKGIIPCDISTNPADNDGSCKNAVYGQFVGSDGTLQGGEFLISTEYAFSGSSGYLVSFRNRSVAFDSNNNRFFVLWSVQGWEIVDGNIEYEHISIYGRFVDAQGGLIGEPFVIVSGKGDAITDAIAFDYIHSRYLLVGGRIKLLDVDGNLLKEKPVSGITGHSVTFDGENFLIAYEMYQHSGYPDVYALLVTPEGELIGSPYAGHDGAYRTFVVSDKKGFKCIEQVASVGSKNSMIVWPSPQNENSPEWVRMEVFGFVLEYTDTNDIGEYIEGDPDGDGISGDGILADGDGSGVVGDNKCTGGNTQNCDDNCVGVYNTDQVDGDGDGAGDVCDNCPSTPNSNQTDTDSDGVGDVCDTCTDTDGDGFGNPGYPANTCQTDNCPYVYNPDQADTDSDGVGDACDTCPLTPPVCIAGVCYRTLQEAYYAAGDGDIIQSQAVTLIENPDFYLTKSVTIQGGYNCDYSTQTGKTILNGNMTISNGMVTIENFIIQ